MRMDAPDSTDSPEASVARMRFALAAAFAGMWLIGLSVFSILTANPVTLNREQVLSAADVLTVIVEDANAGTVRVEKSWQEVVSEPQLTLPNLPATRPATGDRLLIPVSRTRGGWRVTLSKLPNEPPLVYPVTPDSETQLKQLLKAGRSP